MQASSRTPPIAADPPTYCKGHPKFTDASPVHTFRVQNETIILKHDPEVFPPSAFGLRFAEQIDFSKCSRAADIGTGTGLLAILAAKKGLGEVKATDISSKAVELANHNARVLNSVNVVDALQGHFFAHCKGLFDLITANLPQEIIPPAYSSTLSCLQSQAINGQGVGGNQILLDFLEHAPNFMHAQTKLYIIVNTITDYRLTLQKIEKSYGSKLIWQGVTNVKAFVRENIDFFDRLIASGIIDLIEDEHGAWRARQFIYQLTLPP